MNLVQMLFKHTWVLFIVVTCANALIISKRSKPHIANNPDLEHGYKTIVKSIVIWGNIPWLIMGFGILLGHVPSVLHFFRPMDGNPFIIIWFASVFWIWILSSHWFFFKNGAEILMTHPGIFNQDFKSPMTLKLFWLLSLVGGIIGVIMIFVMDIPIPNYM